VCLYGTDLSSGKDLGETIARVPELREADPNRETEKFVRPQKGAHRQTIQMSRARSAKHDVIEKGRNHRIASPTADDGRLHRRKVKGFG
jgi:hypothetical protein